MQWNVFNVLNFQEFTKASHNGDEGFKNLSDSESPEPSYSNSSQIRPSILWPCFLPPDPRGEIETEASKDREGQKKTAPLNKI